MTAPARPSGGPPRAAVAPPRLPVAARSVLPGGLTVVAVERPTVPLVELRLWIPWPREGRPAAVAELLAETLLAGTHRRTGAELAATLQRIGGGLTASADPDRLGIAGSALAGELGTLLDLLAECLVDAAHPPDEVTAERGRLARSLAQDLNQPHVLARQALLSELYGRDHPYATELPAPEDVDAVTGEQVRALHARAMSPGEAVLVLVGDVGAATATAEARRALRHWTGGPARPAPAASTSATPPPGSPAPSTPSRSLTPSGPPASPGRAAPPAAVEPPATPASPSPYAHGSGGRADGPPVVLVHRAGATQANIRLAAHVPGAGDPRRAAVELANLVLGGYLSSRLFRRLRDELGYAYRVHGAIEDARAGSRMVIEVDAPAEVAGEVLEEIRTEAHRLATAGPGAEELARARDFALGGLALETDAQADIAMLLFRLAPFGADPSLLRDHVRALARVTRADLIEVAAEFLAPERFVAVVVADAATAGGASGMRRWRH